MGIPASQPVSAIFRRSLVYLSPLLVFLTGLISFALLSMEASAPAAGRALSSKDLMKMMVKGEKAEVLTYLRTLPVEERGTMRRKLLKGLEAMQNRKTGEVSSGSESSESNSKMRRMSITQGDSADVRAPIRFLALSSIFYEGLEEVEAGA